MARLVIAAYGVLCYLFFLAAFLYAIAFVGDFPIAPKTIDSGAPGGLVPSLIIDVILLGLFAVQHSVMARPAFKRWWTKLVAPAAERSTYVLMTNVALVVLYAFWRPLTQPIWTVAPGPAATALGTLFWIGWAIVLISTFLINHFELFGLTQVYNHWRGRGETTPTFRAPLFYRLVRHPIYVGFILAFWATAAMTLGHLVFAIATLGYMLIAIQLEEHDLIGVFGDRYVAYRARVGMLLPKVGGGSKPAG